MTHTILIVHPERGHFTERKLEEVTLHELQRAVGGYIEQAPETGLTQERICMFVNEEGLLQGLPVNENLLPFFYVGNAVFVAREVNEDGELDLVGLDAYQKDFVERWLVQLGYIAWRESLPKGE